MRKICKKLILILVFFNIFYILNCGINNKIVYAVPNSINETMSKEEIMEKYYELKKDNQELIENYNKLYSEWSSKKDNIDNRVDKIEVIGASIFLILTILGVSVYQIIKGIDNKIKLVVKNEVNNKVPLVVENEVINKVPKEVERKIGDEINHIEKMVEECKREEKLKEEKNILIISKNKEEEKLLKDSNLLSQFKEPKMKILEDKIDDLNQYDVILFNDINGYLEDSEMNRIVNISINTNLVYFYFTKTKKRFESKKPDSTNFANINTTFVGNLLDLMKYQDDVLKNNKINN
ncbi:NARF domain-containing protein [Clostridium senegalense]|uniref:Nucleotidyltransferase-Associated Rossmannoid Fold domain-containing protein n=1 Tax=Clostridium senegalense TaxID=1465809 RepID=A0A6M0H6Z7_9CLOT|nr:NARF domain-containing protein [Clostridium senegalense]NEU06074.1 hypothetical protein [Clostridium senegalense]